MPWRVMITRPAEKDLTAIPKHDRQTIIAALRRFTDDPRAVDLRKLTGREREWRLRVGRWRALLRLDNASGTIVVLRVLPRGSAYQD